VQNNNVLTLILTAWEFKKPFFYKNENKSWMAKAKYFFKKSKMPC
jgi:hypothetical protein